jgi:glucosamine 6-phosphate synthetase-like amidotransferase/phosphosugar isomerase protein
VLDFLTVTHQIEAPTIVLTDHVSEGIRRLASHAVLLPGGIPELFTPIPYITALHLFGYHLAIARGADPMDRRYNIPTAAIKYQGD